MHVDSIEQNDDHGRPGLDLEEDQEVGSVGEGRKLALVVDLAARHLVEAV